MKVLITGATGMLGYEMTRSLQRNGLDFVAIGRSNRFSIPSRNFIVVDIRDRSAVERLICAESPDIVIHAAAITDARACEEGPALAYAVNAHASGWIAEASNRINVPMIYISSEAVYGSCQLMHSETDECRPEGVYATTKLEGERLTRERNPNCVILRATPVGATPGARMGSLVDWFVSSTSSGQRVVGYRDVVFSPISTSQLADLMMNERVCQLSGVYNVGSTNPVSKCKFLRSLADKLHMVDAVEESDAPEHVKAKLNGMNTDKFAQETGIAMPEPSDVASSVTRQVNELLTDEMP